MANHAALVTCLVLTVQAKHWTGQERETPMTATYVAMAASGGTITAMLTLAVSWLRRPAETFQADY